MDKKWILRNRDSKISLCPKNKRNYDAMILIIEKYYSNDLFRLLKNCLQKNGYLSVNHFISFS